MPRLVVFDLDGTLIDSQQDLAESANAMLETYGAPPLAVETVASMVGDGSRQLVERALAATSVTTDVSTALSRFLEIYARRLVVHTTLYRGIRDALEALAPHATLAVLTNKPEALSRRVLDAFDLSGFFTWIIGGDSSFPRKPDPQGLLHLIAVSGATPETTAVVGDSMVDVETARRAGATVVAARYGFGRLRQPLVLADKELVVDEPSEIPAALGPFLGSASAGEAP